MQDDRRPNVAGRDLDSDPSRAGTAGGRSYTDAGEQELQEKILRKRDGEAGSAAGVPEKDEKETTGGA